MIKSRSLVAVIAALICIGSLAAPATGAATYPTGTFTTTSSGGSGCPDGYSCTGFRVTCSGVKEPGEGHLARRSPNGPKGLVMFFTDAGGTSWTSIRASADGLLDEFVAAGLEIVQVRWTDPWLDSAPGEKIGPARLGCRPATVIKWVEANLYNGSSQPAGRCGFCITGESGGASQISYALAFYGLDGIVDAAIPVSGPPHAALMKGCVADFRDYTWPPHAARTMDNSYGYSGDGPCEQQDASWSDTWLAGGVDTGGADYVHPGTRITFLLGTKDGTRAPQHALDYADKLKAAGSPNVSVNIVEGMQHSAWDDTVGVNAVRAAILQGSAIPGTVPSLPNAGGGSGGGGGRPGRGGSGTPAPEPTPTPSPSLSSAPTPTSSGTELALPPGEPIGGALPWILTFGSALLAAAIVYRLLRRRGRRPSDGSGPDEPGPAIPTA
ncbi:MAG: hypothetical protein ACRDJ1_02525 [Actinomycetota bacterium]